MIPLCTLSGRYGRKTDGGAETAPPPSQIGLNPSNIEFKSSIVRLDRVCEVFDMLRGQVKDNETAVLRYY